MGTLDKDPQLNMFEGLDEGALDKIIKEGETGLASFIYKYNIIVSEEKKIDILKDSDIEKLAETLKSMGYSNSVIIKQCKELTAPDNRAKAPELLDKKPGPKIKPFATHIEATLPEHDK